MNRKYAKILLGALAVVVLAAVSMTEQGQVAARWALKSIGAASNGNDRYQVSVLLQTSDGRSYEHTAGLSEADVRDIRSNPGQTQERMILEAKKAMAERMGYAESRYGADHYKMLSSPKLAGFKVTDTATGRSEDMFRDERRRGAFDNVYSE